MVGNGWTSDQRHVTAELTCISFIVSINYITPLYLSDYVSDLTSEYLIQQWILQLPCSHSGDGY